MGNLTGRETEILKTLLRLSEASDDAVFDIPPGADRLGPPTWPADSPGPTRDEVRELVGRGFLNVDKSAGPTWRFWPSEQARATFGNASEHAIAKALEDPDQRLGGHP
jgi:hypothetical protein